MENEDHNHDQGKVVCISDELIIEKMILNFTKGLVMI